MQERKLGKGLDVLFADEAAAGKGVKWIRPDQIRPNPSQPRKVFHEEAYLELKRSIAADGILQPVLVRQVPGGFELIAGERRWRAAKDLGLKGIPALVRAVEPERSLELALVENIQRSDLNPIETASAYRELQQRFGITQEQVAGKVGKNRSTVANALRLLELPKEIRDDVSRGTISSGHARAILAVKDSELQLKIARRAASRQMSVRETERLVQRLEQRDAQGGQAKTPPRIDPVVRQWEETLQGRLGTKVRIQARAKSGKGKILIEFFGPTDFERIVGLLGVA